MRAIKKTGMVIVATLVFAGVASAQDSGNFDGYTLRMELIGGAQYEPLYILIPEWEAATGANVEILSRKSHFELDCEMKQDIAAGNIGYCVFSNHTNFAPQYIVMTQPLNGLIDADTIAAFSPLVISHATVNGKLLSLPRHSDVSNIFYMKSLYEDEANKATFRKKYGYELTPPLIAKWGEVSSALWPRLQAAILGDVSAQEALDAAAKEVAEIMEDAGYS